MSAAVYVVNPDNSGRLFAECREADDAQLVASLLRRAAPEFRVYVDLKNESNLVTWEARPSEYVSDLLASMHIEFDALIDGPPTTGSIRHRSKR
jgi:hypothetical protein